MNLTLLSAAVAFAAASSEAPPPIPSQSEYLAQHNAVYASDHAGPVQRAGQDHTQIERQGEAVVATTRRDGLIYKVAVDPEGGPDYVVYTDAADGFSQPEEEGDALDPVFFELADWE